jgi:hypothetical protein
VKRVLAKLTELSAKWQDLIIWIPASILVMGIVWWLAPAFDPRSGIDGFGDLFVFSVQLVKVVIVLFVAWTVKRAYFHDLGKKAEKDIHLRVLKGDPFALRALILDRIEYLALLVIIGWFVF